VFFRRGAPTHPCCTAAALLASARAGRALSAGVMRGHVRFVLGEILVWICHR